MNPPFWELLRQTKGKPLSLSLLFRRFPETMASLLSDDALKLIEKGRSLIEKESPILPILNSELDFRSGRNHVNGRLAPLLYESPFCFPVVFRIRDNLDGLCRGATVQLFSIFGRQQPGRLGRSGFLSAAKEAVDLADQLIPGTDRPWIIPKAPELAEELDGASAGLAFFLASICFLLGLPYPREVLASAALRDGHFEPVQGIAEKAKIALLEGFSFFIVCGPENAVEATEAIRGLKSPVGGMEILELSHQHNPEQQFFRIMERILGHTEKLTSTNLRPLLRFLFSRARQSRVRNHGFSADRMERIAKLLPLLPAPGHDGASDTLRLSVLGELGQQYTRCRKIGKADEVFNRQKSLCRQLLKQKRCPANFEDHWFALPLHQGLLAMQKYNYATAKRHLETALEKSREHWPPNRDFEGVCIQARGRLAMHRGLNNTKEAEKSLDLFRSAQSLLDDPKGQENRGYIMHALVNLGRWRDAEKELSRLDVEDSPHPTVSLAQVRQACLEGVLQNRKSHLQSAVGIFQAFQQKKADGAIISQLQIAGTYAALAQFALGNQAEAVMRLQQSRERDACFEGRDPADLSPLFAQIWLAFFAIEKGDEELWRRSNQELSPFIETDAGVPIRRKFQERLAQLADTDADSKKALLKPMLTSIHYGIPGRFFKEFTAGLFGRGK